MSEDRMCIHCLGRALDSGRCVNEQCIGSEFSYENPDGWPAPVRSAESPEEAVDVRWHIKTRKEPFADVLFIRNLVIRLPHDLSPATASDASSSASPEGSREATSICRRLRTLVTTATFWRERSAGGMPISTADLMLINEAIAALSAATPASKEAGKDETKEAAEGTAKADAASDRSRTEEVAQDDREGSGGDSPVGDHHGSGSRDHRPVASGEPRAQARKVYAAICNIWQQRVNPKGEREACLGVIEAALTDVEREHDGEIVQLVREVQKNRDHVEAAEARCQTLETDLANAWDAATTTMQAHLAKAEAERDTLRTELARVREDIEHMREEHAIERDGLCQQVARVRDETIAECAAKATDRIYPHATTPYYAGWNQACRMFADAIAALSPKGAS